MWCATVDDYILNGQKTFITNGPDADVVVVYAKLDEGDPSVGKRDRKVLTFVLDRGMEGFVQSKPLRKMGIHSSRTGELFFDNVRLGRDRLLGETGGQRTVPTTAATVPGPTSPPSGSAWLRWRWASSRNAFASVSTTRGRGRSGVRRSPSSS